MKIQNDNIFLFTKSCIWIGDAISYMTTKDKKNIFGLVA